MKREITYSESIKEALLQTLARDKKVIIMGLGVDDPKGVFGTTLDIHKKFRKNVFDLPTSENSFTGFGLGLAISKFKPIIVHQRVEFSLLSIEQIFNQISKWNYMSGGKVNVPMVIRLIIGKGWGQGPQHSQSLETIFAHMPGLKVVCPSNAIDAKGMLISSIKDPDPVIFFEHRWLHSIKDRVPKKYYFTKINNAKIIKKGKDITVISFSYALIEALRAVKFLKKININCELIDLRCLRPIDKKTLIRSVKKTKKALIVDNGWTINGISAEISSIISESIEKKIVVRRIGLCNVPIPSSPSLAKYCYPDEVSIIKNICKILKKKVSNSVIPKRRKNLDQPDLNFKGPF
tara:strand:+ start:12323 stop:13369 length:1047 start_codon:yes stop_codon:yes gene_type:complete